MNLDGGGGGLVPYLATVAVRTRLPNHSSATTDRSWFSSVSGSMLIWIGLHKISTLAFVGMNRKSEKIAGARGKGRRELRIDAVTIHS